MSIAYQCRELVAGPTVGYQVGGQGDGSAYNVRQQPHQQQQAPHQQPQQMRGLSCFSIYVHSSEDKGTWRDAADGLGGDSHGVLRAVGKEQWLVDPPQSAVAGSVSGLGLGLGSGSGSVLLGISKDSGCNLGAECKVGSGDSNYRGGGLTGDALFQDSSVFASPKDSVSQASSSIGENDSVSCSTDDDDETAGDMEVESKLKGPLDCLAELEDSLPMKRGLSNFFTGKSKSFTCLADVASVKDLSKPDNPYNKRRRNLIYSGSWDRNRFHLPRSSSSGISKKGMHTSKSTLALAVAMSKSEDSSERDEKDVHLPPLPPQGKWQRSFASPRSFSLTDLQGV